MAVDDILVRIEVKSPEARKTLEQILGSLEGFSVQTVEDKGRPDLLVFELGTDMERDFRYVESLINTEAVGEVFLTSERQDQEVLLQAIRTGAKEFLPQPLEADEVRSAFEKARKRREVFKPKEAAKTGRVIDMISSKGGIGNTTLAVNLAVSLAEKNPAQSVALVDMNTTFGEVPLFLDIQPKYHWGEVVRNIARLDSSFLMNVMTKHASGVFVLPSPSYFDYDESERATPAVIERLLTVLKRAFDFTIIDSGQPVGDPHLKVLAMADTVFLTTVLTFPCLANTKKLLESFGALGYPAKEAVKVVVNRYIKSAELSLKDAEESIKKQIFWTVPNDYASTMAAINRGTALSKTAPDAAITKNLMELAGVLTGEQAEAPEKKKKWGLFGRSRKQ
jgi:pilus assembly protein CpaE